MRIGFKGKLVDEPEIRAGFVGCGSHSFRNIYPTFQFAPVKLIATCDLEIEKAEAFKTKFGAEKAYSDYHEMIDKKELDFVIVSTPFGSHAAVIKAALDRHLHTFSEKLHGPIFL